MMSGEIIEATLKDNASIERIKRYILEKKQSYNSKSAKLWLQYMSKVDILK